MEIHCGPVALGAPRPVREGIAGALALLIAFSPGENAYAAAAKTLAEAPVGKVKVGFSGSSPALGAILAPLGNLSATLPLLGTVNILPVRVAAQAQAPIQNAAQAAAIAVVPVSAAFALPLPAAEIPGLFADDQQTAQRTALSAQAPMAKNLAQISQASIPVLDAIASALPHGALHKVGEDLQEIIGGSFRKNRADLPMAAPLRASRSSRLFPSGSSLAGDPPPVPAGKLRPGSLEYKVFLLAYEMASQGKGEIRFGAVVVDKDGRIIGKGRNRLSEKNQRKRFNHTDWKSRAKVAAGIQAPHRMLEGNLDYSIHAEQDAIADALAHKKSVRGATTYTLGVRKDGLVGRRVVTTWTCRRCAVWIEYFGLKNAKEFTRNGWESMDATELYPAAAQNNIRGKNFWKRQQEGVPVRGVENYEWVHLEDVSRRAGDSPQTPPAPHAKIPALIGLGGFMGWLSPLGVWAQALPYALAATFILAYVFYDFYSEGWLSRQLQSLSLAGHVRRDAEALLSFPRDRDGDPSELSVFLAAWSKAKTAGKAGLIEQALGKELWRQLLVAAYRLKARPKSRTPS